LYELEFHGFGPPRLILQAAAAPTQNRTIHIGMEKIHLRTC